MVISTEQVALRVQEIAARVDVREKHDPPPIKVIIIRVFSIVGLVDQEDEGRVVLDYESRVGMTSVIKIPEVSLVENFTAGLLVVSIIRYFYPHDFGTVSGEIFNLPRT